MPCNQHSSAGPPRQDHSGTRPVTPPTCHMRSLLHYFLIMKPARSFASDNNAGVHPEVLKAVGDGQPGPCRRLRRRSLHGICGTEIQAAFRPGDCSLLRFQRDRGQLPGPESADQFLSRGDLRRSRPHLYRRMRRSGEIHRLQAHSRSRNQRASSRSKPSVMPTTASAIRTTCSPASSPSPRPRKWGRCTSLTK